MAEKLKYQHSIVGIHRGKRVWKFLPTNYRTKREAKEAGEEQRKRYGYLYRIAKMRGVYRDKLTGGYRLYVFAPQVRG